MDLSSIIQELLIFALFLLLSHWVSLRFNRKWRLLEAFPGPKPLPIIGSALLLNKENHELFSFAEDLVERYGKVLRIWLFHKPYVVVADPDVVEKVLSSPHALDKGDDMRVFHNWWGNGLLTAEGPSWRPQRKLLNPYFSSPTILSQYLQIFDKEAKILRDQLSSFAESGEAFDILPMLTKSTLNVICETAMGTPLSTHFSTNSEQSAYISSVQGMYHILLSRMTRPWLRPDFIWWISGFKRREQNYLKILHGFTRKVILEKISKNLENGENYGNSFLDHLLQCNPPLSFSELQNQVETFLAAGHDTTAYTVAWVLHLLAKNPKHQELVKEEIASNMREEKVDLKGLSKLTKLSCCVKEALRLYPIVPFNFRRVSGKDLVLSEKLVIPSGTNVVLMPHVLHRDEDVFNKGNEFRPERWGESEVKIDGPKHPFGYLPFSLGRRNCIGMKFGMLEVRVVLGRLLGEYEFLGVEGEEQVELDLDLVTRPKGGKLWFRVRRRSE